MTSTIPVRRAGHFVGSLSFLIHSTEKIMDLARQRMYRMEDHSLDSDQ